MNKKYCKFNDKIYLVEKITGDEVIFKKDNINVKTSVNNIQLLPDDFVLAKKTSSVKISVNEESTPSEIMLRHMTKDEAIFELDKFIDKAITSKVGRVRIIHGRHGGVLRKAVHEYLSSHPFVKEYYLASFGEGDIGVTIALIGWKKST